LSIKQQKEIDDLKKRVEALEKLISAPKSGWFKKEQNG